MLRAGHRTSECRFLAGRSITRPRPRFSLAGAPPRSAGDVGSASECKGKLMAATLASASVLLQAPAGAAALPAGFASTGVVAAGSGSAVAATGAAAGGGGGLGTGAIVGIVAGAGAAAVGAVVVAGKSNVSKTSYTGPFNGPLSLTLNLTSPRSDGGTDFLTCVYTFAFSGTLTVTLDQSSGPATGQARANGTATGSSQTGGPTCTPPSSLIPPALSYECAVTGTTSNLGCSEGGTFTFGGVADTTTFSFSGALSGGVISGTVTYATMRQGTTPAGGGTTVNGSMSFPVTLR